MLSKKYFTIVILLTGVTLVLFYLSPVVNAFEGLNVENGETPVEEPATSPEDEGLELNKESRKKEGANQEKNFPELKEQANPWPDEQDSDESGLTARQVAEKTCEKLPAPGEVEDSLKPLMRVQVTNMAFNIEREFFKFPSVCDEIIQKWIDN